LLFSPPGVCSPAENISADLTGLPLRTLGRSAPFAAQALLLPGDRFPRRQPSLVNRAPPRRADGVAPMAITPLESSSNY